MTRRAQCFGCGEFLKAGTACRSCKNMTNNKPNDALLPCPFCGQVPIITKHHREEMYSFMHRCEVLGPISRDFREDPADHVKMWNTRAKPAGSEQV